jgi:hypothetical protein
MVARFVLSCMPLMFRVAIVSCWLFVILALIIVLSVLGAVVIMRLQAFLKDFW